MNYVLGNRERGEVKGRGREGDRSRGEGIGVERRGKKGIIYKFEVLGGFKYFGGGKLLFEWVINMCDND